MPPVIAGYHDRPERPVPGKLRYVTLLKRKMKNEKEFFPEVPGRFLLMMERLKQGGAGRGGKPGTLGISGTLRSESGIPDG